MYNKEPRQDGPPSQVLEQARRKNDQVFRFRKRSILLLSTYLAMLITPWVFTCILIYRPISKSSYLDQTVGLTEAEIRDMEQWYSVIDMLNRITATIAVPIVSALLAQGAVVYTQRRKSAQKLGIRQMLALADRGWKNFIILWNAISLPGQRQDLTSSTSFLWAAAALTLLAATQPALQSVLIRQIPITIVTCQDTGTCVPVNSFYGTVAGYDPEPQFLALCPQNLVVQTTMERILTVSDGDVQPNLWHEPSNDVRHFKDTLRNSFYWFFEHSKSSRYFVSALRNGTTTGVLRQHAARMDTQVNCTLVESFPSPCPGTRPFEAAFSHEIASVRICAEGRFDESPWTRSRDKEIVSEQVWIQLEVQSDQSDQYSNYSMRCDSNSTRGWFEVGNLRNGRTHGPLLDKWPTDEEIRAEFNDKSHLMNMEDYPAREEPEPPYFTDWVQPADPFGTSALPTPGPLMTSAMALFGNSSFFYAARMAQGDASLSQTFTEICEQGRFPFYRLRGVWDHFNGLVSATCTGLRDRNNAEPEWLPELIRTLFTRMRDPDTTRRMFEVASYFANEALLIHTAQRDTLYSREIMSAPGDTLIKPQASLRSIIVLSVLVGVQALALVILGCYIYAQPTWTGAIDAEVLINLGSQLSKDGQSISKANGIIGVVQEDKDETLSLASMSDEEQPAETEREGSSSPERRDAVLIGLGGLGPITKELRPNVWKMAQL